MLFVYQLFESCDGKDGVFLKTNKQAHTYVYIYIIFQEYEEPVYSYSTYPGRR